jgi:hypothetical protein
MIFWAVDYSPHPNPFPLGQGYCIFIFTASVSGKMVRAEAQRRREGVLWGIQTFIKKAYRLLPLMPAALRNLSASPRLCANQISAFAAFTSICDCPDLKGKGLKKCS